MPLSAKFATPCATPSAPTKKSPSPDLRIDSKEDAETNARKKNSCADCQARARRTRSRRQSHRPRTPRSPYTQKSAVTFLRGTFVSASTLKSSIDRNSSDFKKNARRVIELLTEIKNQEEQICQGGGEKAMDAQHKKGRLTARERITKLI